jgi:hypothetical protein
MIETSQRLKRNFNALGLPFDMQKDMSTSKRMTMDPEEDTVSLSPLLIEKLKVYFSKADENNGVFRLPGSRGTPEGSNSVKFGQTTEPA